MVGCALFAHRTPICKAAYGEFGSRGRWAASASCPLPRAPRVRGRTAVGVGEGNASAVSIMREMARPDARCVYHAANVRVAPASHRSCTSDSNGVHKRGYTWRGALR